MFVQSTQLTVAQQRKYLRSFLFRGHVVQWLQCARRKAAGRPKHPAPPENLDALIENFDRARSHPDADDLDRLRAAVLRT